MVRGARHFLPANRRAYEDDRNNIWFDDAKAFFAGEATTYDFIISEPTNPWVSGVSSLFTVEFYREAKRYLKQDGVMAQWIQGYELSDELMVSVLAAIDREFADYVIVRVGGRDWMILASPTRQIGPFNDAPLAWPGLQETWALLGIHDLGQVDNLIVANRSLLHAFLQTKTPNSDRLPILDTGAERARFLGSSAEFLHALRWTPAPLIELLGGIPRRPYPIAGVGDRRDPHVLREGEQAALLMRLFADPKAAVGERMSGAAMSDWQAASNHLRLHGQDAEAWSEWLTATYGVYSETASHLAIHDTPWWKQVRATIGPEAPDAALGLAVELMDALSAGDGERLSSLVPRALDSEDFPLPKALVTIAGLVGLHQRNASTEERQRYAREVMTGFGDWRR